ncbi:MAG: rhomboid family intramembrane serine protease [Dehalococcoidia bacterium]|nr:rhomboid family intramembrane serine protease [Dehalococcoidia bacterium]
MFERSPFQQGPEGGGIATMLRANPAMWSVLAINLAYFLLLEVAGGSEDIEVLIKYGAKYGPNIADGQFWRLITPMFMHIGIFHLLANSVSLLIFGGIVERSYGWRAFLAIYLTAGVAGNVASYTAGPIVGAGASGAIFGMLGAFAVYLFLNRAMFGSSARGSLGGLAFIIIINVSLGLTTTGVDNSAHLGGLIVGTLMALRISPRVITENTYALNRQLLAARSVYQQSTLATIGTATLTAFAILLLITVAVSRGDTDRNRTFSDELTGQALSALLEKRFEDSGSYARLALLSDPSPDSLGKIYSIKGLAEAQLGEFDDAIRDLQLAMSYDPSDPEIRLLAELELAYLKGR